jgi:hypothetical protein
MKGKTCTRLTDLGWMCDFAFFAYITHCLNELNSYLQGTNQLTNEVFAKMKSLEIKFRLCELQL